MKKIITAVLLFATIITACNESKQEAAQAEKAVMHDAQDSIAKPDFSKVQFASKRDTTCSMPLTAGVSDTAIVDGKTYGFCSKECKEEFMKTLQVKK